MAFDQSTRNRLQKFVSDSRTLLSEEFTRQLQNDYGLDPHTGTVSPLENLGHLDDTHRETARILRETLAHYLASSPSGGAREALERIIREQAFTVLNRLAALRMTESRGILLESVGNGYQSKGFQLYERLAGSGLGEMGDTYRCYLFSIFDEFALDLKVLFDRFSPQGRLFPRETALLDLLKLLNDPDLAHLWAEDETIGWIYQYFNSKEERKKMRDESAAPRNSRELAVRNQFFTPRYVVEFLTDNTLGRIWYEMTQGETGLKDFCHYLVRRSAEIFLKPGETAPEQAASDENLSQEELLRQPVYISHRLLKDPRTLRMLDPACGSMHFGLYSFDLYERIYEEAWELELHLGGAVFVREAGLKPLTETYPDKEAFLRDVPRLIIEHNIHGIDIDPRAVQIAGLSLWLRAQRSWHNQGVKPVDRPRITRSNIVCAEPMPGEKELLRDFTSRLEEPALGYLVEQVFDKMQLAGEAGSLLKIEEEIRKIIAEAKQLWKVGSKLKQIGLFGDVPLKLEQVNLPLDYTGITDKRFWEGAEEELYQALHEYAEVAGEHGYQRRLFAEDTARGFSFIDNCRKLYDLVLMNPPFGRRSDPSSNYFDNNYGSFKSDMGLAFVECFSHRLSKGGQLGSLTSRTFMAGGSFAGWRRNTLLANRPIRVLLDLGIGVLDDALVETCAYVIQHQMTQTGYFIRALEAIDKRQSVENYFMKHEKAQGILEFTTSLESMRDLPTSIMAYWLPTEVANKIKNTGTLESIDAATKHGVQTTDDFQFMRLAWEVPLGSVSPSVRWPVLAKGGEYAPYFDNLHLCVDWLANGDRLKAYLAAKRLETQGSPDWTPWMNSHEDYFKSGLTFPARTASDFCPRILPSNCVFTASGQALLFPNNELPFGYLGGSFTRSFKIIVDAFVCSGDNSVSGSAANTYRTGLVNALPLPTSVNSELPIKLGKACVALSQKLSGKDETSLNHYPLAGRENSIKEFSGGIVKDEFTVALQILEISDLADRTAQNFFGFSDKLLKELHGPLPTDYPKIETEIKRSSLLIGEEALVREAIKRHGPRRQLTKKTFHANRRLELLCHIFELHPLVVFSELDRLKIWSELFPSIAEDEVSLYFGCTFGRWDIRFATGDKPVPELPDPFTPLPVCPSGMLQNTQGLPAELHDVPEDYPLLISWPGILVDDEGHKEDVVGRIREVIEIFWKDRAGDIEHEACEILSARSLRDYFAKPSGFFSDHLKRYSKSRRQAPIYWPLSTPSGSYTLWIYYHRLNDQTLYTCVMDYVEPKLHDVANELSRLRQKGGGRNRAEEKDLENLQNFEMELREFRDELLRLARIPWKPNLNDGVQITAAPLWKLFQLPKWKKTLKETWEKLEKGDYDWAHLAYSIWPDRVREKCKKDKSLAIAHDLEDLYIEPPASTKKKRGKKAAVVEDQD